MNFYADLADYMAEFYGYGTFEAPYWFIGMEEAGEDCHSYIRTRVDRWTKQRGELVDLHEFNKIEWFEYFDINRPKVQSTWRPLLRLLFNFKGYKFHLKTNSSHVLIGAYQATKWGRKNGETCLAELFPLPCSLNQNGPWIYSKYKVQMPFLISKNNYENSLAQVRITNLKSKILRYKPKYIVFNGTGYLHHWTSITGTQFQTKKIGKNNIHIGTNGTTTFVVIPHSSSRISNKYIDVLGTYLRRYF